MMLFRCHPERSNVVAKSKDLVQILLSLFLCAAILVACGDDDSDISTKPSDGSPSSVTPKSSDSETSVSSSSTKSSSRSEYIRVSCDVETDENCFEDASDGQTYKTVKIGDQVWMAENLNYAYTGVPYKYETTVCDSISWCYKNAPANCTKYGRLYLWSAAMDSAGAWSVNGKGCGYGKACSPTYPVRGICPDGWHLPDTTEWNTLFTAVGGKSVAGSKIKSTSGWSWNGNGTDVVGFSALPAGYRRNDGSFYNGSGVANFWSATEYGDSYAYYMSLHYYYDDAFWNHLSKYDALSVRCLQD